MSASVTCETKNISRPVPTDRHTPQPAVPVAALNLLDADREASFPALYADFAAVVRRLRRDCPWDREQTHDSVKQLTIEEAYELVHAIDAGDPDAIKKELGDLFLHVLFHADIAETAGTFTIGDVMVAEMDKLVRRHPHVFGETVVSGTGEVLKNWEAIKRVERQDDGETAPSALDGVPPAMPALLRAERVQEKAAAVGFDFPTSDDAFAKVREEVEELTEAAASGDADRLEAEFGDVLFALVNVGRLWGVTPENALRRTVGTFSRRFQHVEARLAEAGRTPDGASLDEMDALWDEAKALERAA